MTLLNRLLLLVFGAGLIPIVPAGFFLFYYQSQSKANITAFEQSISEMAALMTERETQDLARRLERMWVPGTKYVDQANLNGALKANPEFLYMAFTRADGREILSGGAPELRRFFGQLDISGSRLFRTALDEGRLAIGQFEMVYDIPICRMVFPLGGGYFAFAAVNLRDLLEKLYSQRLGVTGGLLLADAEGSSLAFSRSLEKFDRQAVRNMLGLGPVFEFEGARGVYVGAAAQVRGFDLYAIALEEKAEAFSGINRIIWLMAFLLLAVSTAFYFSALAFTRSLAAPVEALLAGASRVSGGDFNTEVGESSTFSELGGLISAFNSMMRELKRYHGIQVEKVFEEKQKLELLVSLIHDAIILCDFRGELLYANAAAKALLPLDGVGSGPKAVRTRIADFVACKSKSADGVIELETPAGKKNFHVNLETLAPKTQRPAVFMVLRDVTLEREVQRVKEEFFQSVAHDLRAPLLTMQGYIKLLGREFPAGGKQAGYVKSVSESSDRLFNMLENILDISRMEAGRFKPDLRKIQAADFLSSAAESFRAMYEEKGVELAVEAGQPGKIEFSADSSLLRRVIENLLSNACKFTPKGGKVTASVMAENGGLLFTVEDTGPGIPVEQLEAVFERYKQLNPGEGETGFGLGLAIARKIVALHGGKIWAEASSGGVFKFTVPSGHL